MKCTLTVLSLLKATHNHSDFKEAELSVKSFNCHDVNTNTLSGIGIKGKESFCAMSI